MVRYRTATVDGHRMFYRDAGEPTHPALLLLHASRVRRTCSATSFRCLPIATTSSPLISGLRLLGRPGPGGVRLHFRQPRSGHRRLHRPGRSRALCHLRLRLRGAGRLSRRAGTARTRHCDHLAERQRVRRRLECRLPSLLQTRPHNRDTHNPEPETTSAIHHRPTTPARQCFAGAAGQRRDSTRPVPRLCKQHSALSQISRLLQDEAATVPCRLG